MLTVPMVRSLTSKGPMAATAAVTGTTLAARVPAGPSGRLGWRE